MTSTWSTLPEDLKLHVLGFQWIPTFAYMNELKEHIQFEKEILHRFANDTKDLLEVDFMVVHMFEYDEKKGKILRKFSKRHFDPYRTLLRIHVHKEIVKYIT